MFGFGIGLLVHLYHFYHGNNANRKLSKLASAKRVRPFHGKQTL